AARPGPARSLLDMCTGSGAVAVALKHERPEIEVFASDISPEALETARLNAVRLLGTELNPAEPGLVSAEPVCTPMGTEPGQSRRRQSPSPALTLILSDLFGQISRPFHLITANPPYVKSGEIAGLPREIKKEPRLALDGGEDGLDHIRAIIAGAPERLFPGGGLLLEADPRQMPFIASLLEHQEFRDIQTYRDLSGAERVIGGRTRED
ncbi:MAG: peptide chain release factor N(5)-glutamine methyltransferase, partial [Treponema sp.]|nr:peptide chain release factor N(5)-glutamine methyltransferase [Treponema sp.]